METDWLKQVEEFNNIWVNRRQTPIITESWVDNDWAKGRTDYLTFLIRVKGEQIANRIKEIQTKLETHKCFDAFPKDYLHLTVKELNSFLVATKQSTDEYTDDDIPQLIEAASEKLRPFKGFEIRLENLNNFKSTVVVEAHDGGAIRSLNGALLQIPGVQKLRNDYPKFLPHMSIAQYRSKEDYEDLIDHLEELRETCIGTMWVDKINLVVAKLPVRGRYPCFRTLAEFKLE